MKIKILDFGYKNMPTRAHDNDAGMDVYVTKKTRLFPCSATKIPLGFGLEIPDGYCGFIMPRSGLSSKGITCELSPIDSGYRGEVHAIVTNCNNTDQWINEGERIGQLVILPIVICDLVTERGAERGDGAFGSTGI